MRAADLREWQWTPQWERRIQDWTTGSGHGPKGDLRNDPIAFTPLRKPLGECVVALATSAGVHLRSQPAFDLLRPDGDWSYREIPSDAAAGDLVISHSHYDHGDADLDVNCMFPIDRLREVLAAGTIGAIAPTFYGLMGFAPNAAPLLERVVPPIVERMRAERVDVAVLSPG